VTETKTLLIRCKGCLCYEEVKAEPFKQESINEFIAAHQFCPEKD